MRGSSSFLNTGGTTPSLLTTTGSGVLQAASGVAQVASASANAELGALQQKSREANRAALVADEAKAQEQFGLAQSALDLQRNTVSTLNKIAQIDEAERISEERQTNAAYVFNQKLAIQSEFMDFQQQALNNIAPDGKDFAKANQEFFNSRIKSALDNAPTEDAKLAILQELEPMKLNAIGGALKVEQQKRAEYRTGLVTSTVNESLNKIISNPSDEMLGMGMGVLEQSAQVLRNNGAGQEEVSKFVKDATGQIVQARLTGLLNKGDLASITQAESDLNEIGKTKLDPSAFERYFKQIQSSKAEVATQMQKELSIQHNMYMYQEGLLSPADPNFDKTKSEYSRQVLWANIPNLTVITASEVPQVASLVSGFFAKNNEPMDSGSKQVIDNMIQSSSNPNTVAALSMAMSSLIARGGTGAAAFNSLSGNTKEMIALMAPRLQAGVPADIVYNEAKTYMQQKANLPADFNNRKTLPVQPKAILKSALDEWFASDYSEEMLTNAENLFKQKYAKTRNEDLAKLETVAELKTKYALSDINGSEQPMEGAPELYLKPEALVAFKDAWSNRKQELAKQLGIVPDALQLVQLPYQSNVKDKVSYTIFDSVNARFVPVDGGGTFDYQTFEYSVDPVVYNQALQNKRNMLQSAHQTQQQQLKQQKNQALKLLGSPIPY